MVSRICIEREGPSSISDVCTLIDKRVKAKNASLRCVHCLRLELPFDFSTSPNGKLQKFFLIFVFRRCYGQALKLLPDVAALWHDLGVNYFYQSQLLYGTAAVDMATKSLHVLQKAVTLDPLDFRHWTALGRVACYPGTQNAECSIFSASKIFI